MEWGELKLPSYVYSVYYNVLWNEIIKCDLLATWFFLSLGLSKKRVFYTCRAYFNHAANLLKYFDKLLKINK